MDPYLEDSDIWSDFHGEFIHVIRGHLHAVIPERYVARIDRHIWVDESEDDERLLLGRPDVYVADPEPGAVASSASTAVADADPVTVDLPFIRRERNRYIRIMDARERRVITVIEVLSPSNKAGGLDRRHYLAKRDEYLGRGVNLVEIDLLRGGQRMPLGKPPPADYYVLVSRAARYPKGGLWPIMLRQPLPPIPIPLDAGVPEVFVHLEACFAEAYDEGRFASDIDYTEPPTPPLTEPDASWSRDLLAARTSSIK
jgi:hypothetical protein